ncbi:MAG: M3 family oligoendopeptidase [Phycisphaerales bacterium]|nr:M3 family oligoendopeptidase [Phycisphaerales bacterium]MDP6692686.1 M3 family oligoendopeptidase [Phycisphaerales bacterium]
MTTMMITDFVPADIDATSWDNLQPYYQQLLDREIKCSGCLEQFLLDRSELDATAAEAGSNLYIAMTCNTEDEEAKNGFLSFVENVEPELKKIGFELNKKVVQSSHVGDLDQDRFKVLLRDWFADVEIFRDENVPLQTQDTKLGQKYSEICGAMMVEFDGEEKTMPQMGVYQQDQDRQTREAAWRCVAERRLQDRDTIDGIFDKMVNIRDKVANNAGFEEYRGYSFAAKHRFDYTPEDCIAFHDAIEKTCMPIVRKLAEERKAALGVDTLRPWDLAVDPYGHPPLKPFDTADELIEKSSKLFHSMDSELGDMFDSMRDGGVSLDLASRKGKAPGGYQASRDRVRKPFIFMNAAGLPRDLDTMVHEAGHAFHYMLCRHDDLVWYRGAPIEFAEVASMSMESLAYPFLSEFYSPEETKRAVRKHLEGIVTTLAWVATIDSFQHWIYLNPERTRGERTAQWLKITKRFGGTTDWTGLEAEEEALWHRQLHPFEVPFYYVEYGIAQLGALQMWLQYRNDPNAAIALYKEGLALGASKPLPQLFETCGLRFDFTTQMVGTLMKVVEEELDKHSE